MRVNMLIIYCERNSRSSKQTNPNKLGKKVEKNVVDSPNFICSRYGSRARGYATVAVKQDRDWLRSSYGM